MVAIITARSGSKRIPKKNIKDFCGRPIVTYSIDCAKRSGLFEEIMVSTDSEEIANIARQHGASVPFLRSAENSSDFAGTAEVIAEVLNAYQDRGRRFEKGCCIYPTAPLLESKTLIQGYELFMTRQFDIVFPIVKYSYPIQRSLKLDDSGRAQMLWPENYNARSQDLKATFHDAGQFYWFDSSYILRERKLFAENAGGLVVDELSAQDIDSESDWQLAELKYRLISEV